MEAVNMSRDSRLKSPARHVGPSSALGVLALTLALVLASPAGMSANQDPGSQDTPPASTLEEMRASLTKWMETEQIIYKERKDWQQGKDVLNGRLELLEQEVGSLEEKIQQAEGSVAEANKKRDELIAERGALEAADAQLTEAVTAMEGDVRRLFTSAPQPIQEKLQLLYQRIPEDPTTTRVTAAERFQNVIGILNELNKANNEITVSYEVRNLADGRPSEVRVIYVGLAQAYYVSPRGEAGIGWPAEAGWEWQPSNAIAEDVLMALEILQGKHTPAFVSLPVTLR